jgi:PAS domain S-box-containing protein
MNALALRKSGIAALGDIPWGTHFCHFYETEKDLLDVVVPFFKAGLQSNEFCIWVVSKPLGVAEAKEALLQVVPEADQLVSGKSETTTNPFSPASNGRTGLPGYIEVLPHTNWYVPDGELNPVQVIDRLKHTLSSALAKGYDGIRLNGIEAWLTRDGWDDFHQYEQLVDEAIAGQRMLVLCSYPLSEAGASKVLDVTSTHEFALVRRESTWQVVESPELKQAKIEIARLNEDLERRVAERTQELQAANERLREEIDERRRVEEQLRQAKIQAYEVLDTIPGQIWSGPPDGTIDYCNYQWRAYTGLGLEDVQGDGWQRILHPEDWDRVVKAWHESINTGRPYEQEERHRSVDNVYHWFLCRGVPLRDTEGRIERWYGTNTDITERKRAEEQLKRTNQELRALSARLHLVREEESARIAREIHDELGGTLSILKWDLEEISEFLDHQPGTLTKIREKVHALITSTDNTMETVTRISTELRPLALYELGLSEAIRLHAEQFQARTGITVNCNLQQDLSLTGERSTTVFRILQEALVNILRHAKAARVTVSTTEDAGEFVLTISDNGKGITEEEKSDAHSIGLIGMRERAHLAGGNIEIRGLSDKGTVITVRIPLVRHEEDPYS